MSQEPTARVGGTQPSTAVVDLAELCRRLYVELFHCEQQLASVLDEKGAQVWRPGSTIQKVLADARGALGAEQAAIPAADAPVPTRYRLLVADADEVQAGDEFLKDDGKTWIADPYGTFVGSLYHRGLRTARRLVEQPVALADCDCHKCGSARAKQGSGSGLPVRMILCPECGNKRCPKASDHRLACTASNEPGQPGAITQL